jgi:hypothetical protein
MLALERTLQERTLEIRELQSKLDECKHAWTKSIHQVTKEREMSQRYKNQMHMLANDMMARMELVQARCRHRVESLEEQSRSDHKMLSTMQAQVTTLRTLVDHVCMHACIFPYDHRTTTRLDIS